MAKFYGEVGYLERVKTAPGIYESEIKTKNYYGNVIQRKSQWQAGENLDDDIVINQVISILADPFAYSNFSKMRYVVWQGVKWKIKGIDVLQPRIILTIGGVYNE